MTSPFGQNDGPLFGESDDLPQDHYLFRAARATLSGQQPAVAIFRPHARGGWTFGHQSASGRIHENPALAGISWQEEASCPDALRMARRFASRHPDVAVFYCPEIQTGSMFGASHQVERVLPGLEPADVTLDPERVTLARQQAIAVYVRAGIEPPLALLS